MAIADPQPFPFDADMFVDWRFKLQRGDAVNRNKVGQIQVTELADPVWTMKATTRPLRATGRARLEAWALSQRGGLKRCYLYNPIRSYPLAYGAAGMAALGFNGNCSISGASGHTATLSGLPSGFKLTAGDFVSVTMSSGIRSLHQIVEAVTASGTTAGINVEPAFRSGVTGSAELVRARCVMALTSYDVPEGAGLLPVTFEAIQALA